ncbi:MAG: putative Zn finger-like uncharacterized protein [Polaribacter sp.]|jgi:predicted Zn finger-like uncharacterized protein
MHNSILYTRCPTCSTAFKVTNELLAIAAGKVRCGACLAIFQASDYMLEPVKKEAIIETITTSDTKQPESEAEVDTEAELQPEKDLNQAKIENEEMFEEDFYDENDFKADYFEKSDLEKVDDELELEEKNLTAEDLEDVSEETPHTEEQKLSFEEDFDFENNEVENEAQEVQEIQSDDATLDDSSLEFDESDYLDESFEIEPNDQNHFNEENSLAFDEYDTNETEEFGNELELAVQINTQIDDVEADPDPLDEFNDIVEASQSGIRSKIILASIVTLLIISMTQIWTNRQAIAWNDTWAPAMNTLCNALPCKLKPKRAVNEIKLLQRQVSPHQEKEKTLDIKVLLVNQAKFAQPYPVIKIAFSDKNGKEVALKRFKPSNYLRSGSKDQFMPPNAEVHIQFHTKTPHPDALGFEFIFE